MSKAKDIEQINKVFMPFKLSVSDVVEGLRINQYRIELPYEGNLNKYLKLEKNLMAALNDNTIRVFQDGMYLVIEKKSDNANMLTMDGCFYKSMYGIDNKFPLVLGKDIQGNTIRTSLIKAPHILVAGCTGSGKTQMLHSFISSILLGGNTAHLILIDPKGDEFNVYKDVPTVEFISEVQKALSTLEWLVTEMNARYEEKAKLGIENIDDTRFTRIVCIIDEFADLIASNRQIEKSVVLLAQKARAAGIHLIIGTQYPVSDVITTSIKANIPTRVCLKVNNAVESRVAINQSGGEKLIGHGDLLFLGNGMYEMLHIQAPFISKEDKLKVVEYAKKKFANQHLSINEKVFTESEKVSESLKPQKKKRIGFFRALWNASPYFMIEE